MLQATNCVPAHAVLVAAEKARPSSVQAGPAIMSASTHFRLALGSSKEPIAATEHEWILPPFQQWPRKSTPLK
jgi:hypothetical protein